MVYNPICTVAPLKYCFIIRVLTRPRFCLAIVTEVHPFMDSGIPRFVEYIVMYPLPECASWIIYTSYEEIDSFLLRQRVQTVDCFRVHISFNDVPWGHM